MSKWLKHRDGHRSRDLGHGLVLRVDPDDDEFDVRVFGRHLETRSSTLPEAKSRAEQVARRWMQEALLRLSGSID